MAGGLREQVAHLRRQQRREPAREMQLPPRLVRECVDDPERRGTRQRIDPATRHNGGSAAAIIDKPSPADAEYTTSSTQSPWVSGEG